VEHFFIGLAFAALALVYLAFYFPIRALLRARRRSANLDEFPGGRFGRGVVVVSSGLGLAAGQACDLGLEDESVVVRSTSSPDLRLAFQELADFAVAAGARSGGHIVGGGFGLRGAIEGAIGAAVVNAALDRARSVAVVGLQTVRGAYLVLDYGVEPAGGRERALGWVGRRSRARLSLDLSPFTEPGGSPRWVSCRACGYQFAIGEGVNSGSCPTCGLNFGLSGRVDL